MRNPLIKILLLAGILLIAGQPITSQRLRTLDPGLENRVSSLMKQLTTDEKIDLVSGTGFGVRGIARLGIPALTMADGPYGVRNGRATVVAGGIGLAASWNAELATRVGQVIGQDARARGVHFQLAPAVNIYRAPQNGRNFEYFGEDPFLASNIAVAYIKGIQSQGVSAVIKHFAGNNSEYARNYTDAIIDQRALHEIYLPAFEAAVKQGAVGAVMDSYNLVNGAYMSANGPLNIEILKKEWGFSGLLMSDWGSTHDRLGTINGGLDLEMPVGVAMSRQSILSGLKDGSVKIDDLDDKVRRLLRTEIRFGWLDRPQLELEIPLLNENGSEVALQSALESTVLLKNDNQFLPLQKEKLKSVAVIGPLAYPAVPVGGGSAQATAFEPKSLLSGVSTNLGHTVSVLYNRGVPTYSRVATETSFTEDRLGRIPGIRVEVFDNVDLSGKPRITRTDPHLSIGKTLNLAVNENADPECCGRPGDVSYRWSGFYTPKVAGNYRLIIHQSGGGEKTGYRIRIDGKMLLDDWDFPRAIVDDLSLPFDSKPHKIVVEFWSGHSFALPLFQIGIRRDGTWVDQSAVMMAKKADVVLLAVGFDPSTEFEGWDRTFHLPPGQQELIEQIVAANPRAIVILQGGGNVEMSSWIDRVPAILHAWYPGQEGGTALAEIITGKTSPSGHLPVTFERRPQDNPTFGSYYPDPNDRSPTPRVRYKEGIFVGYRGYDHNKIKPMFAFGYGLSYTTFACRNLVIRPSPNRTDGTIYTVSFEVTNAGARTGKAVPQLYIAPPEGTVVRAPKELRGFDKIELAPGETRLVTLPLNIRAFTYYEPARKEWIAPRGLYKVLVGSSSDAIELNGLISLDRELTTR
jgi:beta-glucosidase